MGRTTLPMIIQTINTIIMKRKHLLKTLCLGLFTLLASSSFADGNWGSSAISIKLNNDAAYNYRLNNEGWTDGAWGNNTLFQNFNFGTPASLILNGASGNGWTDDSPGYNTTSFVLYYRVYTTGSTPGAWASLNLNNLAFSSGNNRIYDKSNANIDILGLINNQAGNYTFEVAMSKNQFYTGGNWNSMVPGGQATAYNSNTEGFKATFSIITTDISQTVNKSGVYAANGTIFVKGDDSKVVEIFSLNGHLLFKANVKGDFSTPFSKGSYIVKVNGEPTKINVQ